MDSNKVPVAFFHALSEFQEKNKASDGTCINFEHSLAYAK